MSFFMIELIKHWGTVWGVFKEGSDVALKFAGAYFAYRTFRLAQERWGAESMKFLEERKERFRKRVEELGRDSEKVSYWVIEQHLDHSEELNLLLRIVQEVSQKRARTLSGKMDDWFFPGQVKSFVEKLLPMGSSYEEVVSKHRDIKLEALRRIKDRSEVE